jgi:hypothetical protein
MSDLWKIEAIKTFAAAIFAVYVGAMLYPWIQILFGYVPVAQPGDSISLSPVEYALAASLSIAAYGFVFAAPLLIASLYTVRTLRTRHNKQNNQPK